MIFARCGSNDKQSIAQICGSAQVAIRQPIEAGICIATINPVAAADWHHGGMETKHKPGEIDLGPIRLVQDRSGELTAHHVALKTPASIPRAALLSWLKRQLRELVA